MNKKYKKNIKHFIRPTNTDTIFFFIPIICCLYIIVSTFNNTTNGYNFSTVNEYTIINDVNTFNFIIQPIIIIMVIYMILSFIYNYNKNKKMHNIEE